LKNKIRDFEFACMNEDEPLDNISFKGFVDKWYKNHVIPHLTQTSYDSYKQIVDKYLMPRFGNMKLKDIKKMHIVEYLTKQETMGTNKYMTLKSIFAKATEWEILKDNPMDNIKEPKRKKKKADFYTESELNHLADVLEHVYPKYRMMIKLAYIGGLRRAE